MVVLYTYIYLSPCGYTKIEAKAHEEPTNSIT